MGGYFDLEKGRDSNPKGRERKEKSSGGGFLSERLEAGQGPARSGRHERSEVTSKSLYPHQTK